MGSSGSGKTTLAARLAARLGVPHIELDALHHGPDWTPAGREEFRARVRAAMYSSPGGWIVDGNYEAKLENLVTDAADTLVWLDLPLWTLLGRLWWRTFRRIRDGVELWNGNRESWLTAFWGPESLFVWTGRSYFRHRREWPRRFASHPGLVRLRTAQDAASWLERQSRRCPDPSGR